MFTKGRRVESEVEERCLSPDEITVTASLEQRSKPITVTASGHPIAKQECSGGGSFPLPTQPRWAPVKIEFAIQLKDERSSNTVLKANLFVARMNLGAS